MCSQSLAQRASGGQTYAGSQSIAADMRLVLSPESPASSYELLGAALDSSPVVPCNIQEGAPIITTQ